MSRTDDFRMPVSPVTCRTVLYVSGTFYGLSTNSSTSQTFSSVCAVRCAYPVVNQSQRLTETEIIFSLKYRHQYFCIVFFNLGISIKTPFSFDCVLFINTQWRHVWRQRVPHSKSYVENWDLRQQFEKKDLLNDTKNFCKIYNRESANRHRFVYAKFHFIRCRFAVAECLRVLTFSVHSVWWKLASGFDKVLKLFLPSCREKNHRIYQTGPARTNPSNMQ